MSSTKLQQNGCTCSRKNFNKLPWKVKASSQLSRTYTYEASGDYSSLYIFCFSTIVVVVVVFSHQLFSSACCLLRETNQQINNDR